MSEGECYIEKTRMKGNRYTGKFHLLCLAFYKCASYNIKIIILSKNGVPVMAQKTVIPQGYAPLLGLYDTQKAIGLLHHLFEDTLGGALHLRRVSAPLFVEASTGLNDDLSGVERAVAFDIPAALTKLKIEEGVYPLLRSAQMVGRRGSSQPSTILFSTR